MRWPSNVNFFHYLESGINVQSMMPSKSMNTDKKMWYYTLPNKTMRPTNSILYKKRLFNNCFEILYGRYNYWEKNYMDGQKATRLWIIILADFFENIENWKKYYPLILHKKVPNISVKFIFQIKLLLSVMSLCLRVLRFLINLLYLRRIFYFINYKMLNIRKNIHYYSFN